LGPALDQIPGIAPYGSQVAVALVVIGITALSVIVGELVPKRMALASPEKIAVRVARPVQLLVAVAHPFVWFLERSTAAFLFLMGVPERRGDNVTEEEVKLAIAEGTEAGVIEEVEENMIHGVLALADRSVTSVMTPRPDVYWIDLDDEADAIAREIAECPFSRIVVARAGDIGHPLGVVQKKELLDDLIAGREVNVERHVREPIYVPESIQVLRMLEMFRKVRLHIAFVVDEYGDFLGIVTPTDILSAIAGELPEEHGPISEDVVRRADGSWLVDGRASIAELNEKLGLRETSEEYHTAAGLALERLARIPVEGDSFEIGDWRAEVVDMDGKRIDKLLFMPATRVSP
jgi:putative hemolysin